MISTSSLIEDLPLSPLAVNLFPDIKGDMGRRTSGRLRKTGLYMCEERPGSICVQGKS